MYLTLSIFKPSNDGKLVIIVTLCRPVTPVGNFAKTMGALVNCLTVGVKVESATAFHLF